MDTLAKLFGGTARIKVLRLFIFNQDEIFDNAEISRKAKIYQEDARRETSLLISIGFIRRKSGYKDIATIKNGKKVETKKKIAGYILNKDFKYIEQLSALLSSDDDTHKMILRKLHPVGTLKLVIASGFLIQDSDSRIDLLIVGNSIRRTPLETAIKAIESEIGRELRYSAFETAEFEYRMSIYDRLVRDIMDFPHITLLDRIGATTQ